MKARLTTILASMACVGVVTGCRDAACADEPSQQGVHLADLRTEVVIIDSKSAPLFQGEGRASCAVLEQPVQTNEGTQLESKGGSYCASHDVGAKTGCQDIAFGLRVADAHGVVRFEAQDSSHRVVIEATHPDELRSLSFAAGRVPSGSTVTVERKPHADTISAERAFLRPAGTSGPDRDVSVRVSETALLVELPEDAVGTYELHVMATAAPRILRCEGVAECRLRPRDEVPKELSVQRTLTLE